MFRAARRGLLRAGTRPSRPAWYQTQPKPHSPGKVPASSPGGESLLGPKVPPGRQELLQLLEGAVVHRAGALVAVSKPPGLPVTGLPGELTLESLLPDLRRRLALPDQLHVVKAAGKESSGLVLLSSCQSTTQRLHQFYIKHRRAGCPTATYCAVTVRIPAASEGEVRTGLKLARFGDWELAVPVASPSRHSIKKREVKKTRALYKVLDSRAGCALLQLQPLTAFPCQLLVHLMLLLSPALGDHVYSPRVGTLLGEPFLLAPESAPPRTQVLDDRLLQKLHLAEWQVRRLPLHLHLHQLLLPSAGSAPSVLAAPLPARYQQTLRLLGLSGPGQSGS